MKPESLIFDIDGTLWDTRQIVADGYNLYLNENGLSHLCVTAEYLKGLFGKTFEEIADVLFAGMEPEERYRHMRGCMDREQAYMHRHPCQVAYPGVRETLEALAEKYRLFLVSNAERGYPELLLEKLGVERLFQGHLCYGDTLLCKGDTIRILMQRHNIGSAVYIGDTQGDLEASRKAGIPFVFCRYGFGDPVEWDAAVDAFPELLNLFPVEA